MKERANKEEREREREKERPNGWIGGDSRAFDLAQRAQDV